jgi:Putative prokaryotic signal transducing protein
MPLSLIATYTSPWEAHVTRALLESEGIRVLIVDQHMIGCNWQWSQLLGGVKLLVPSDQRVAALELLAQMRDGDLEAALREELQLPEWQCHRCMSSDFQPSISLTERVMPVLTYTCLGFFYPPAWQEWTCGRCTTLQAGE